MRTTDSVSAPLPALLQGPFAGSTAFAQLVRDAIFTAASEGWGEMVWSDPNFEAWPLREKAVVDALNSWAGKGRKLTLLAHRFDAIQRFQPRFVSWRSTWDHIVECRVCKGFDESDFPSALWSPVWVMRRMDPVRSSGYAGPEPQRRQLLREALEEVRRQSAPGFPASVLGL